MHVALEDIPGTFLLGGKEGVYLGEGVERGVIRLRRREDCGIMQTPFSIRS